ncbi:MAG: SMC-Scp complex subunit ScpB [Gammaproteobacteria bacterium]|nr:MAG: SMC-Scp complex subunit ScpB [Gammaproteobacteria bacterium]
MAEPEALKNIIEAALLAAGGSLSLDGMQALFEEHEQPDKKRLREILEALARDYEGRGIEIREVASGWRIQVRQEVSPWVSRLWSERPPRYSRALLETLALIAYRQPITRGEIEDIRGVSVSSNIIKTLIEREWIRVLGHRDVPGRPALYGTTREFLDYFNLKSLDELPSLAEIRDLDEINRELELEGAEAPADSSAQGTAAEDEERKTADGDSDAPQASANGTGNDRQAEPMAAAAGDDEADVGAPATQAEAEGHG